MDDLLIASIKAVASRYPDIIQHLSGKALALIKTRDPREPGRRRKLKFEQDMRDILTRRFTRQLKKIKQYLNDRYPDKKGVVVGGVEISDAETEAELYLIFLNAILDGVQLFDERIPLDITYDNAKRLAAEYAHTYVTEWLAGLDATSSQAVQTAISAFVETPGMTIGNVVEQLTPEFGEDRAWRIATTEITRAYAEGNQLAGEDMAEQWPGVEVTKTWFTNNDDLVCPLCGPLNEVAIGIDESWEVDGEEYENPPLHPNCRCWTDVTTNL